MNKVKAHREKLGITQKSLAEKSGLSLRTIQRLESGKSVPKGYTLSALSNAFEVEPVSLQQASIIADGVDEADKLSLQMINISVLGFFILPFGNIFIPLYLWYRNRKSGFINDNGRKIINFQMLWTMLLVLLLIISPFIVSVLNGAFPLIIIVLIAALLFNFFIVLKTAKAIRRDDFDFLNLAIRII